MTRVETLIIGGGQAGLSLSRCLSERGRDHLVLERGRIGERWRSERWDSFQLLSPNWATRLAGQDYDGPDPDGFMDRDEVVRYFERYASSFDAPVHEGITVRSVRPGHPGWHVITDAGRFEARQVVLATGHHGAPATPPLADDLPAGIAQCHSRDYRNPGQFPDGPVLVVGSGPSGQQIARELARAGRRVAIAVGRHKSLPRSYRGLDAFRWMELLGMLDRPVETLPDPSEAGRSPSVVLSGTGDLDLRALLAVGVEPVGRLVAVRDGRAHFADDVARRVAEADANVRHLCDSADEFVARTGLPVEPAEASPVPPAWTATSRTEIDLVAEGIVAVVWATGFRRDYSWVRAPITDARGEPVHQRGISPLPGLTFLGLRWQSRRSSSFLAGVGQDAEFLADWLDRRRRRGAA